MTEKAPRSRNSQAWKVGQLVFTGGCLGRDSKTGEFAGSDVVSQAKQALENLRAVLETAGTSLDNAIKITVYLRDVKDMAAFNEVYYSYFGQNPPARVGIQAGALGVGVQCEFDCVAFVPE